MPDHPAATSGTRLRSAFTPPPGARHRRMPGSVVASTLLWGAAAVVTLWSGIDLIGQSHPETAGISSGDLPPSARSSTVSPSDVLALGTGVLVLVGAALLLLGLAWSTYLLYAAGAGAALTLMAGGHVSGLAVFGLVLVAGILLLGTNARRFLTGERGVDDGTIHAWLEREPSPARAGEVGVTAPEAGVVEGAAAADVPEVPAADVPRAAGAADGAVSARPRPRPRPSA